MRRLARLVLGVSVVLLLLSFVGFGLGEGGAVMGIFGVALGAVLHLAGGATGSDDEGVGHDGAAEAGDSDSGGGE